MSDEKIKVAMQTASNFYKKGYTCCKIVSRVPASPVDINLEFKRLPVVLETIMPEIGVAIDTTYGVQITNNWKITTSSWFPIANLLALNWMIELDNEDEKALFIETEITISNMGGELEPTDENYEKDISGFVMQLSLGCFHYESNDPCMSTLNISVCPLSSMCLRQ